MDQGAFAAENLVGRSGISRTSEFSGANRTTLGKTHRKVKPSCAAIRALYPGAPAQLPLFDRAAGWARPAVAWRQLLGAISTRASPWRRQPLE